MMAAITGRLRDTAQLELALTDWQSLGAGIGDALLLDVEVVSPGTTLGLGNLVAPVVSVQVVRDVVLVTARVGELSLPLSWRFVEVVGARARVRKVCVSATYRPEFLHVVHACTLHMPEHDYAALGRPRARVTVVIRHAEREWRRRVLAVRSDARGADLEVDRLEGLGHFTDVDIVAVEDFVAPAPLTNVDRLLRGDLDE